MSTTGETLAARLLACRVKRGLTRNQTAERIGYPFGTYDATEQGARLPQPIEIPALALWLGTPIDELREQLAWEHASRPPAKRSPAASAVQPGASSENHAAEATPAGGA